MPYTQDFFNYLLHQKKYSSNTVDAYRRDLHEFQLFLETIYPGTTIDSATEFMIRTWFAGLMETGLKPSSIKRKKASLTTYYKYLYKEGKIKKIPSKNITTPKPEKRLPVFVPEGKIMKLFEADFFEISDYEHLRDRMILETFYATGMRVSELTELTDSSFDLSGMKVKVLGKRNKERIIPLHPLYVKMAEQYNKVKNEAFVQMKIDHSFFLTKKGKKIYRKLAYRIIFSYLSSVTSMKKKSPHVMRHTFATHLLNEGAEINAIKDLLGHSSLAATQLYTHNTIEKLKTVYKNAHPQSQKRRK
jgi:integrase/recombinase XerC